MSKRSHKFMIGAIVGGTIAAATSLLFGTAKGKSIRHKLMNKFNGMGRKVDLTKYRKKASRKMKTMAAKGWKKALRWKKAA